MWDDDDDNDVEFADEQNEMDEMDFLRKQLKQRQARDQAQREGLIRNAIPPTWTSQFDERGKAYGHGGRK